MIVRSLAPECARRSIGRFGLRAVIRCRAAREDSLNDRCADETDMHFLLQRDALGQCFRSTQPPFTVLSDRFRGTRSIATEVMDVVADGLSEARLAVSVAPGQAKFLHDIARVGHRPALRITINLPSRGNEAPSVYFIVSKTAFSAQAP